MAICMLFNHTIQ